jgi:hypothetical protein
VAFGTIYEGPLALKPQVKELSFGSMVHRLVTRLLSVLIAAVLMAGCEDWSAKRGALAKKVADERRELALIDGYYSADIRQAEQSLLTLVEYYSTLRTEGIDGTLGMTHTRLFLLYSQLGQTNDAARHRSLALNIYGGDRAQEERWAELLHAVARLDRNREVRWKVTTDVDRAAREEGNALDQEAILTIARRAVATNDTWLSQAEFETPQRKADGSWTVLVWRLPKTPGGHRVIAIDKEGKVTGYVRGK